MEESNTIPFVDPHTHEALFNTGTDLCNANGDVICPIIDGVPRFVRSEDDYAENFGFQWNEWKDLLSDSRSTGNTKRDLLLKRTHFDQYKTEGATILECGMGGGDDTEVLLQFPFAEVHSFDLSCAVDRGRQFLNDPRLVLSQASIYDIPYADESFDFVFCHRVLQHTPDPVASLKAISRKVKPGGVLFVHCYKKSWRYLMNYKYKVRWLTKRLPQKAVFWYVQNFGRMMRKISSTLCRCGHAAAVSSNWFVPFDYFPRYGNFNEEQLLELDKLCTFDALTPAHDHPLTTRMFCKTIEEAGFRIEHLSDPPITPLLATAVRVTEAGEESQPIRQAA
ncbi:MAG: class I SAM-dependent methyltransferase [Planctomycetota bacterium]|nr:class I SAM-dependent methyltransferase [Planctomycetota bacterium]